MLFLVASPQPHAGIQLCLDFTRIALPDCRLHLLARVISAFIFFCSNDCRTIAAWGLAGGAPAPAWGCASWLSSLHLSLSKRLIAACVLQVRTH